jgi:pyruvate/oxaloacetate carboxyltransferase
MAVVIAVVTNKRLQVDRKVNLHCYETEELSVDLTVNAFRSGVDKCLTCSAYLSEQVVTLVLKIVLQNGRNFMEVIHAHRLRCVFVPAE